MIAMGATALPFRAQDSLLVEVGGATRWMSVAQLGALPQDTVVMQFHEAPRQRFVGPSLLSVLNAAGADLNQLRGTVLARYALVEARDGYRVVFAVAELSPGFRTTRTILALWADGRPLGDTGPFRVIAEGDLRTARSARNVVAVRLRAAEP
jgi:DMSO/TMAO reductase YedYZ molybdopterin-dependent catalytic subunit